MTDQEGFEYQENDDGLGVRGHTMQLNSIALGLYSNALDELGEPGFVSTKFRIEQSSKTR